MPGCPLPGCPLPGCPASSSQCPPGPGIPGKGIPGNCNGGGMGWPLGPVGSLSLHASRAALTLAGSGMFAWSLGSGGVGGWLRSRGSGRFTPFAAMH